MADQAHRKRAWTWAEDMKLADYIEKHGERNWKSVGKAVGADRDGKSCRSRWTNFLRPGITKGAFSEEEKQLIVELHARHGNKWSFMAKQLPGRTDNEIKNFWNNGMRKKNREVLTSDNTNVQLPKQQLNSSGPSPFSSSMASTSCTLNNPSHVGLCNTQENQLVPVSTFVNHQFDHFQSNYKDHFLDNGLSDSAPMPKRLQFDPTYVEQQPLVHSFLDFTPATTIVSSSSVDRRMTDNGSIFSVDNNDEAIKVRGESPLNVIVDELMSLIDSSSSSGPLPEWSELGC